jgi:1-acyl-sn-glycerol-3-phosphate acyltransferase
LISNHRSYLDPILLLQDVDAYPVAKAELANWPIIGKGAAMAGILYLKRENAKSRAGTLQGIQQIIAQGHPVIIYPEGTTSALPGTLPFKRGVFQLAAKHQIPVVPVAVVFAHQADFWVGKESFLSHAGRRFRLPEIPVSVHYGAPMIHENAEQLLQETQKWIESILLSQPADAEKP